MKKTAQTESSYCTCLLTSGWICNCSSTFCKCLFRTPTLDGNGPHEFAPRWFWDRLAPSLHQSSQEFGVPWGRLEYGKGKRTRVCGVYELARSNRVGKVSGAPWWWKGLNFFIWKIFSWVPSSQWWGFRVCPEWWSLLSCIFCRTPCTGSHLYFCELCRVQRSSLWEGAWKGNIIGVCWG